MQPGTHMPLALALAPGPRWSHQIFHLPIPPLNSLPPPLGNTPLVLPIPLFDTFCLHKSVRNIIDTISTCRLGEQHNPMTYPTGHSTNPHLLLGPIQSQSTSNECSLSFQVYNKRSPLLYVKTSEWRAKAVPTCYLCLSTHITAFAF